MILYNVIVPSLANSGPTNLAIDLAEAARRDGMDVSVFYLSKSVDNNLRADSFHPKPLKFRYFINLEGIVHTHGLRPDIVGYCIKILRKRQTIVLTTIHMHFVPDLAYIHGKFIANAAFLVWGALIRRFDFRFCISRSMLQYYQEKWPGLTLDLAYNGVLTTTEVKTAAVGVEKIVEEWVKIQRDNDRTVLGYVGALIERKNVSALFDFVLHDELYSIVICGDGNLFNEAKTYFGNNVRFLFLGKVTRPEEITVLIDALVLPSFTEGLPLVVIEAAARGVPSILSDIPVHRELAEFGLGFVFDHQGFSNFDCVVKQALTLDSTVIKQAQVDNFSINHSWKSYRSRIEKIKEFQKEHSIP